MRLRIPMILDVPVALAPQGAVIPTRRLINVDFGFRTCAHVL